MAAEGERALRAVVGGGAGGRTVRGPTGRVDGHDEAPATGAGVGATVCRQRSRLPHLEPAAPFLAVAMTTLATPLPPSPPPPAQIEWGAPASTSAQRNADRYPFNSIHRPAKVTTAHRIQPS